MENSNTLSLLASCMTAMDAQSAMYHLCSTEGEIARHARELKALKPYAQGFGGVPKLAKAFNKALALQVTGTPAQRVAAAYEAAFAATTKQAK